MVKILLTLGIVFLSFFGNAQEEKIFFSEAISMHLPKYEKEVQKAFRTQNIERTQFLFDSLVSHCLKGSYLDNFEVRNLKKEKVRLDSFDKPIFLITRSSWCISTEGEAPALNELAAQYRDQLSFVILFWDTYGESKKEAQKYTRDITILYVDELKNQSSYIIRNMKHSLGFPTYFLLDENRQIKDVRRSISHPYGVAMKESFTLNYNAISQGISLLLLQKKSALTQKSISASTALHKP